MSKFFSFTTVPGLTTFVIAIRLDTIAAVFVTASKEYETVTEAVERKRSFLERAFKEWGKRTKTVETSKEVWHDVYNINVTDRLSRENRHITIAKANSSELAEKYVLELRAALEAS